MKRLAQLRPTLGVQPFSSRSRSLRERRRGAKRSLKAPIVSRPAPPPRRARLHGNAGLGLPPPPRACRPEAVRARGFWENGSGAAFLRRPRTAKLQRFLSQRSVRESGDGAEAGAPSYGLGPPATQSFPPLPGRCGRGKGRARRARELRGGKEEPGSRLRAPTGAESPPSPVSSATLPDPSPTARFVLFRGPGVSRRVLGAVSGRGGAWADLARGCREL